MFKTYWLKWLTQTGNWYTNVFMSVNDAITAQLMDAMPENHCHLNKVRGKVIDVVTNHLNQLIDDGVTSARLEVIEFAYDGDN